MDVPTVAKLFAALERRSVDYAVVGGVALNLHGLVRATVDLDLFIRPEEDNVARLRVALKDVWDDPAIDEISIDELATYAVIRYGPPDTEEGFVVDVMCRVGTEIGWDDHEVLEMDFEGAKVKVASPRTLYRMKKGTLRPVYQADALNLREVFELDD